MKKRFWSKYYTSEELGLPYKGFTKIYIRECGAWDHKTSFGEHSIAHTHVCKESKFYTTVCFKDKKYVKRNTILHELAHILDISQHTLHEAHTGWVDGVNSDDAAHGKSFHNILRILKKDIYPFTFSEALKDIFRWD